MARKWNTRCFALCCCLLLPGCAAEQQAPDYAYLHRDAQEVMILETMLFPREEQTTAQRPEDAVALWMDEVKGWGENPPDLEELLHPALSAGICRTISGLAQHTSYRLGNSKIEGNRAQVDVDITSPDFTRSLQNLAGEAAGRRALEQLLGEELPWSSSLLEQLEEELQEDRLLVTTRHVTVYLLQGGDSGWKLDVGQRENLEVLDCLTGGVLGMVADTLFVEANSSSK